MQIRKLLSSGGYAMTNLHLAKQIGVIEAFLFGQLCNEAELWANKGQLGEDGYFYTTIENITDKTGLTAYQQRAALAELKKLGLIEVVNRGLPQKRYIKINDENVLKYFEDNEISKSEKFLQLDCKKSKVLTPKSKNFSQIEIKSFNESNIELDNSNSNIKESITLTSNTKEKKPKADFETVINDLVCDEELKTVIHEYINMRKGSKYPLKTEYALKLAINKALKLANNNPLEAINIFNQSIVKGWADVYPVKDDNNGRNYQQPQKPFKSVFDDVVNPYTGEKCGDVPPEVLDCFDFSKPLDGFGF